MGDDDLICICMTVTRGEITRAIAQGAHTVDELKSTLFCCTGCGTCEGRVRALLEGELQKAQSATPKEEQKAG
jgi:NAD(P)H-nitrite reductase large subunit